MSDDNSEEEMLRQEIADLKKKLVISEETRERNLQDSICERNSVINKYQDEINRVSAEKDDEIRILSKANELFRAEVVESMGEFQGGRGMKYPCQDKSYLMGRLPGKVL
ncbi:hypothetical protein DPMN_037703 [Dreissena polymorpha]|uniref:Uncharacterized protein n=1 Tax=Dreissena polymorpha TaxID=45954 RepID=A0A9D4ME15_DREPO|nr:hypothetical protein DPMN_037703 [Dreissena polymorpha]